MHQLFKVWSPDSVAECLSGIPDTLYVKIWRDIVPKLEEQQELLVCEDNPNGTAYPGEVIDSQTMAYYWDMLTKEEQEKLNELATLEELR